MTVYCDAPDFETALAELCKEHAEKGSNLDAMSSALYRQAEDAHNEAVHARSGE